MSQDHRRRARSFGSVADAYDRGRPTYPDDAARWLTDPAGAGGPLRVLELGAGTGKLTARLVALGHDVHATEPDPAMLELLRRNVPDDVRTSQSGAEEIPVPDRSVDVVVAAQCYHWFDPEVALPEIARVLKPGGHLALVWHERDERIPWVKKLGRIIGTQEPARDSTASLAASSAFDEVEARTFTFWQAVDRRSVQDLALSRSTLAVMDDAERERTIADLLALYDDYGRGMDGMQLPYLTRCYRARVADRPDPEPVREEPLDEHLHEHPHEHHREPDDTAPFNVLGAGDDALVDSAATLPRVILRGVDDDTATVLIDFR